MRILLLSVLLSAISILILPAQNHPDELEKLASSVKENLVENILPFWTDKMTDTRNGGFFGRMDGNNTVIPDADRGGILNARILWTFSSAFRVLKDSSYLKTATYSRDYIFRHFIDRDMAEPSGA